MVAARGRLVHPLDPRVLNWVSGPMCVLRRRIGKSLRALLYVLSLDAAPLDVIVYLLSPRHTRYPMPILRAGCHVS